MNLMGITLNGLSLLAMSLVAGVLVDDAIVEIENIVRHMRMGKSAYQASLDAADEIGLAVLATTMSIVAVFLPVALMPGISGQFFKAFGFTVVISVLMSLLVARMITPLIAAYFLRSHGVQPHANLKWMHAYLRILNWSLDTSKAHARLAALPRTRAKLWYYFLAAVPVLLILAAFLIGVGMLMKIVGMARPSGRNHLRHRADRCRCGGVWRRQADHIPARHDRAGLATWWHDTVAVSVERADPRSPHGDGRRGPWRSGAQHRPVRHVADDLPAAAQPRLLDGQHHPSAGSHAQADRNRRRPGRRDGPQRPRRPARVRASQCRLGAGQHRPQEGPHADQHRVRAQAAPELSAIPDGRVSFQSQGGGGPGGGRATSCCSSAATTRRSWSPPPTRLPRKWPPSPVFAPRASAATSSAPEIADQAALRPGRRPWRHHRGAEPDDPHRDARRHRAEQREILAVRPPGADHRYRCPKMRAAISRRSRICPCRLLAAARCR